MGRRPCCVKEGLNRGAWTCREDRILTNYIAVHGEGKWRDLPQRAGLKRCGKSCRLRWLNYLRPGIKRGNITEDEEELIVRLHNLLGNRWSLIAGRIPGRTDNEIKNYWNTNLSKRINSNNPHGSEKQPKEVKTKSTKKPSDGTKPRSVLLEPLVKPSSHQVIRTKPTRFNRTVNVNSTTQSRAAPSTLEGNEGCDNTEISTDKGSPSFYSSGLYEYRHLVDNFDMDLYLYRSPTSNFDHQANNEGGDGMSSGEYYGFASYNGQDNDPFQPDDAYDHLSCFTKFLHSEEDWDVLS